MNNPVIITVNDTQYQQLLDEGNTTCEDCAFHLIGDPAICTEVQVPCTPWDKDLEDFVYYVEVK